MTVRDPVALVILPKEVELISVLGFAHWGLFKKLTASARAVKVFADTKSRIRIGSADAARRPLTGAGTSEFESALKGMGALNPTHRLGKLS